MRRFATFLLCLALAAPVSAQPAAQAAGEDEEALCANRPGLATTPCTVGRGRVHVELAIDWSFQEDGDERVDTLLAGDTLVRVGIDDKTEVQLGWTPYGQVRVRDAAGAERTGGVGDVSLAVRRLLTEAGPLSIGLQAGISLPLGGAALGAGDWGAELLLPISYGFGDHELALSPLIAAAVDADGDGRHVAYGLAAGLTFSLSERLFAVLDLSLLRDEDPSGHTTEALLGLAVGWILNKDLQLDAGAIIGLNSDSPDLGLYVGAAKRF